MPVPKSNSQSASLVDATKFNIPWHEVLAQVRDAVICTGRDGVVIYWNAAAARLWGWPAEEMLGQPVFLRLPEGPSREWGRELFRTVLNGEEFFGDRHDYRKDGSRVWIEVRSTRINDASGQPVGIVTIGREITERRQAEQELKLFRNLVDQSNDTFEIVDPVTGRFLDVNERACLNLGYTRDELLSMRVHDINPSVSEESWPQIVAEVHNRGSHQVEAMHRRKDGTTYPVEVNVRWVMLDRAYIIASVRDISEHKQEEERLRHSEAMMAAAQRLAHFGSWELDLVNPELDANPLRWSDECYRIFGFEPGSVQVTNDLFFSRIPPGEHEAIRQSAAQAIANRSLHSIEHRIILPSGEVRFVHEQAKVILDETNLRPVKLLGTVHDITERRKAEMELRRSEDQFRSAMQFSAIGMALVALNGHWLEVNQAICDIVGYSKDELLATDFQSITHPDDLAGDLAFVGQLIAGERQSFQMEKRYIHKQGHLVWVLLSVSLVRDDGGRPCYFISQIQDITERKRSLQELVAAKETAEAATRTKSEFLAMISHEIRTPLNPILGAAQLLLDEKSTPEQQELLRVIQNAGEHLLTLLTDLLDLAKMESGSANLMQTPCRLGELVQGVFEIKHEEARAKQLALKLEADPNLAFAYAMDEPRLRQILLNLIGNAVKFTAKGQVKVQIERLDQDGRRDQIKIQVSDSGIGIAPAHLRRVFEPFYQVDSSLMRQHEGAGLGLAICKRLVETMGGEIGAESRPGEGSTFWLTLWLERRRSLDEVGTPWPMRISSLRRHCVLLACTNEQERLLLVTALEKAECEVTRVTAGADVLAFFTPGNFDLLLIDQQLPDVEWPQLVESLRQREAAAGVAATSIVLLARDASEAVHKMAQAVGVNSLLIKPVRQVELLRMLMLHGPLPTPGNETTIPPPSKSRE